MKPIRRATVKYEDLSQQFKIEKREFDLQYYAFYNARFDKMVGWLKEAALEKWGKETTIIDLNNLMEHAGKKVCVVGTILKTMKLQPSILREVSDDLELVSPLLTYQEVKS